MSENENQQEHEQLSPEEIAKLRKEQEAIYDEELPLLRKQAEYEKLIADVEEHRYRRIVYMHKYAQHMAEQQAMFEEMQKKMEETEGTPPTEESSGQPPVEPPTTTETPVRTLKKS